MTVNKIIVVIGIMFAIFVAFVFLQFRPLDQASTGDAKTATATINDQTFTITVAKTEEEKQKGLSGIESLPLDEGKLFIFDQPDTLSFWMKDMKFPIDIIFINDDKIVSIVENAKPVAANTNLPIYQPTAPSDKALEINAGLSKKYNFKPGDTVELKIP